MKSQKEEIDFYCRVVGGKRTMAKILKRSYQSLTYWANGSRNVSEGDLYTMKHLAHKKVMEFFNDI